MRDDHKRKCESWREYIERMALYEEPGCDMLRFFDDAIKSGFNDHEAAQCALDSWKSST